MEVRLYNLVLTKGRIDVVNTGNNMKVIDFCKEAKERLSLKQRKIIIIFFLLFLKFYPWGKFYLPLI